MEGTNYNWQALAKKGATLPKNDIYAYLREQVLNKTDHSSKALASTLEITPQVCSTYATGTDKRSPPTWVILRLAQILDVEIIINSKEVRIRPMDGVTDA